jgi:methyl-accepting chemotaxis protein
VSAHVLPSAADFRKRVIGLSYWVSIPGVTIILAFLMSLLRLTQEQWEWFLTSTGIYALCIAYPMMRYQAHVLGPITDYLSLRAAWDVAGRAAHGASAKGGSLDTETRYAFSATINLPRRMALMQAAGWIFPCVLLSSIMAIRFVGFGWIEFSVVTLAGVAAGFVAGSFLLFMVKGAATEVRTALALEIADPDERRELVRPMSLHTKLVTCVTGVAVIPIVFALALSFSNASSKVENFTIQWQQRVLTSLAVALEHEDLGRARSSILGGAVLPAPLEVEIIDLAVDTDHSGLLRHEIAGIRREIATGALAGDSMAFRSAHVFAWRSLGGERILMAETPSEVLELEAGRILIQFAVLLAIASLVGWALARLLAGDVVSSVAVLRREAEKMASGDLRAGDTFESEDELGELSRAFAGMASSLRKTVSRVAEAADRIEATATETAAVSESVASVTGDQVTGIQQASTSMEAINVQVGEIADFARTLNGSVEESSSSILELGASGQDLNDTAETLSARVEEVSGSIEQMVRSVQQVSETTATLAEACDDTSSSMEEMAGSLRESDTVAEETARLSRQVVDSAESGQDKVRQTIDGMDAIRVATETAEQVIRNLGARTDEIGAIVDVIDDVADETNLLALNAAIIAAQAGEHGKAFSVVADEIKDLADRVFTSTKEIGSLIRAVQDEGSNAIGAIELGTQSVASGVDLSAEAGLSLEEITRASRESGSRIQEIVGAMRGQAAAASHVVGLMERVASGVEQIRGAALEQESGNQVVFRSATTMREVAHQVRGTTEEQARGSGRIRESVEEVRDAVEQINSALQEQSAACRTAVDFLEEVFARTRSNTDSTRRMDEATKALLRQSTELREDLQRFQI